VIFQDAISYIQNAPSGKPLFLYIAPFAPHDPFTAAPQDIGRYSCCLPLRPPSFNEADVSDKPLWVQGLPLMTTADITTNDSNYRMSLDTLASLDRDIQTLINALVATGRWGNTVLLVTSDNGLFWGEHRLSNAKDSVYEEAVKVPLWIRVPGQATRTESALVENIDLAPTIAAWAAVTPPTKVNGLSLVPLLNQTATAWRTEILLEELGTSSTQTTFWAVRDSQFVYVEYADGQREFYDLLADPYQLTNQINNTAYSATISTLQSKLAGLKTQ
jgi:arylsulfatase A-like enzyme